MDKLSKIFLTDGSPFLPIVTKKSLDLVALIINSHQINPITAIAYECLSLGERAMMEYLKDQTIVNIHFTTTTDNIKMFFQGYATPLISLSNCCIKNESKADRMIQNLPEQTNGTNPNFSQNAYALDVIHRHRPLLKKSSPEKHMANVAKLFNYCENFPFSKDKFFLIGIVVAQTVYREFYTRIDIFPKAFTYMGEIRNE